MRSALARDLNDLVGSALAELTADGRLSLSWRLGDADVELLVRLHDGLDYQAARSRLTLQRQAGRRPSACFKDLLS